MSGFGFIETQIAIGVGLSIIRELDKEAMRLLKLDREDYDCLQDQLDMDYIGYGINGENACIDMR
jgi:hypothetical protein